MSIKQKARPLKQILHPMKFLIIVAPLFVIQTLLGQNSFDTTSVLSLKQKTNYKEVNKFWHNNGIILWQEVTFNDPNTIDEEYSLILSMRMLDSTIKTGQRLFDLAKDSAILKYTFNRLSVWKWSTRVTRTVGQLKIISMKKNSIEMEFDLMITEQGKDIYVYQGKRVFKKSKKPDNNNIEFSIIAGSMGI